MNTTLFDIEHVTNLSPEIIEGLKRLSPKIGGNYKPPTDDDLQFMFDFKGYHLIIARSKVDKQIIGMISLVVYRIPYVKKAKLEDLVVDEAYRGQGIGTVLIKTAIEKAKKEKAYYIDFTSRPSREAGNQLYEKLGFEKREANVYRYDINYEKE
jgi:ribosomal protein S18 acetylase RimI-like enzyme